MAGMSLRAYARHRRVTLSSVQAALANGRISTLPDGTIDPARADCDWEWNTDTSKPRNSVNGTGGGRENGAAPESFAAARARRERAAAALAELELEQKRGNLIPRVEVERGAFAAGRATRDALERVAPQIAPHLLGLSDLGEIERRVAEAVHVATDALIATLEKPAPRRARGKGANHAAP